jgi:hypothetical protein
MYYLVQRRIQVRVQSFRIQRVVGSSSADSQHFKGHHVSFSFIFS